MKRLFKFFPVVLALVLSLPLYAQNGAQGPERPELMGKKPSQKVDDETGLYMEKTAFELVYKTPPQVKEFASKLCERVKWDKKVVDEMVDGLRPEDEALAQTLTDEFKNFMDFVIRLGIIAERHTNVRMVKNGSQWSYSLTPAPELYANEWIQHVPGAVQKEGVRCHTVRMIDNVYHFCEIPFGGQPYAVPVDDDEIYIANVAFVLVRNIGIIYENGVMQFLQEVYPSDKDRFERTYNTCLLYLDAMNKAIENNKTTQLAVQPMPKAGAMNASMKAKVLPLEKAIAKEVVDCVVTSDNWEVQKDVLGNPIRRVIYGYSIVQTAKGKQATRVSWAEDYQGGGTYGAVHAYGVGGGQFYVK